MTAKGERAPLPGEWAEEDTGRGCVGVGVTRRGRLAGPVTPACAPGSHPGSPTSDKASGGLPGPPPGSGGHEAGCPRGWGGRGPPTRKLLVCAGIHGVCVGVGSAHHRRYACDTRERRVGQTPACTAARHTRLTGSGVETGVRVWGRPCARHVWVKPVRAQET